MKKFIWIACLIYCLNGFGHIIIGTVLESMVHSYDVAYGDGGQLIMNQFLGFLVGVLFAPLIVKSVGRRMTVVMALLLFSISQFLLGTGLPWNVLLLTVPLGGAGMGILESVIAALIIGHLKEKKATILVLVEVFFGVGALLIPIISAYFILSGAWHLSFMTVSILVFITMLLWLFLPFGQLEAILKKQPQDKGTQHLKKKTQRHSRKQMPLLITGAFFFFMYVGTEMVLPNYLPTILGKTTDLGTSALAMSITVFWVAMTFGRMSMTFIIDRIGYHKLFIVSCIGQFLSLVLFASSTSAASSFVAIFLAGLFMGGIFSIGLLIINEMSDDLIDWTTSILVAMGGLGGALLPKLVGILLDYYVVHVTLWVIVLFSFMLTLLMGVIYYYRKSVMRSLD